MWRRGKSSDSVLLWIFEEILDQLGQMPLPPYITHRLKDKNRYQTVYAEHGDPRLLRLPDFILPRNCWHRFRRWE